MANELARRAMLTRGELTGALASDLLRYLSEASDRVTGLSGLAGVFDLERTDLERALAYRLASSDLATNGLSKVATLVPVLPPSRARRVVETQGVVRGQVSWGRTFDRRLVSQDPTLFVTSVPERRYETNVARLVKRWLETFVLVSNRSGFHNSAAPQVGGSAILDNERTARRLLNHPKIRGVAGRLREQELGALEQRSDLLPLVEFLRWVESVLERNDPRTVVSTMESVVLAPRSVPSLYELYVGFRMVDAFESLGLKRVRPWGLLEGGSPLAQLRDSDLDVSVFWQKSLTSIMGSAESVSRRVARINQAKVGTLRPDLLVVVTQGGSRSVVVGEVKFYEDPSRGLARGIVDAMAYLKDAELLFRRSDRFPHAFVVAAGAQALPALDEICVGSHEDLDVIARLILA